MKKILMAILLFFTGAIHAQNVPVELMLGNEYLNYQHSIHRKIATGSRFGWMHISNMVRRYETNTLKGGRPNEMMNQGYLTVRIHPKITFMGGFFYTPVTDIKVSLVTQFAHKTKNWFMIVSPRFDAGKKNAYELFGLLEYQPTLTTKTKLYSRFQFMTNHGNSGHNRSYQQLRIGIDKKAIQFGIGITIDQYGTSTDITTNSGLFIRKLM
ncbi:MAG: hypothetical protein IBJ16_04790 [Chitinophagaceae bacterium]|nr:hypothetical protein [Chitinophagaceae bacterium]